MILQPSVRVRGDIMARLDASSHHFRNLLHGLRYGIECEFHVMFVEEPEKSPESRAAAILKLRFCVVVPFVDPGWASILTQVGLGLAIAAEN